VSFVNAMEGAADRERRAYDLAITCAWHTAVFALNGYSGKLKGKSLSDYLSDGKQEAPTWAKAHAFFSGLKAKGLDVKIERVVH
jgi:hypothetical protein